MCSENENSSQVLQKDLWKTQTQWGNKIHNIYRALKTRPSQTKQPTYKMSSRPEQLLYQKDLQVIKSAPITHKCKLETQYTYGNSQNRTTNNKCWQRCGTAETHWL